MYGLKQVRQKYLIPQAKKKSNNCREVIVTLFSGRLLHSNGHKSVNQIESLRWSIY